MWSGLRRLAYSVVWKAGLSIGENFKIFKKKLFFKFSKNFPPIVAWSVWRREGRRREAGQGHGKRHRFGPFPGINHPKLLLFARFFKDSGLLQTIYRNIPLKFIEHPQIPQKRIKFMPFSIWGEADFSSLSPWGLLMDRSGFLSKNGKISGTNSSKKELFLGKKRAFSRNKKSFCGADSWVFLCYSGVEAMHEDPNCREN